MNGSTFYFQWEVDLMVFLQTHLGQVGAVVASVMSEFGEELAYVAVIGFLYWCYDKEFGRFVGLNLLVGVTLNPMVKNIFLRRRPYVDNPSIKCLKPAAKGADIYDLTAQGFSFPSGHSTNSVVLFGSLPLYRKNRWLRGIAIAFPILIGVSRFCLGVHYPTDVLCGWLLGAAVLFGVPALHRRIKSEPVFYGLILLATLPGMFYCQSTDYFSAYGLLVGYVFSVLFEQRFVSFDTTRSPVRCLFRVAGGIAVFLGVNTLLKLPFSEEFLGSASASSHIFRSARYAAAIFLAFAVYPLVFRPADKFIDSRFSKSAER